MQDNTGTITVSPTLTDIGKRRLLENKFHISKIALSDDGVNYKLTDRSISNPDILVKRSPLLKVWTDSPFQLNNKLILNGEKYTSTINFNPNFIHTEDIKVHPVNMNKMINFPQISSDNDDTKYIKYFLTSNELADSIHDLKVDLREYTNNFDNKVIAVTLSEGRYFNIYTKNGVNSNINFGSAFDNSKRNNIYSKTINIRDGIFYLMYNSRFRRKPLDRLYECSLILMDQDTGQTQKMKLQITSKEAYSEATQGTVTTIEQSEPDPPTIL